MNTSIHLQLPFGKKTDSLDQTIEKLSAGQMWEQISVAVAYSSLAGVARLDEVVREANPDVSFRWLLGLDDFITHPGAIDFCKSSKSEVRVYQSKNAATRFHPKVFLFDSPKSGGSSSMIIGSANLTFAALNRNCEAVSILDAQNQAERQLMHSRFESLWKLGTVPVDTLLSEYKKQFEAYRKSRAFLLGSEGEKPTNSGPILRSDSAIINPGSASVCWIEVGKNTALGKELEFKGEQARFFGLEPTGGEPAWRNFRVSNGRVVPLRLKYQGNAMWRLQLQSSIPEVAVGLRPKVVGGLGRSPHVGVFKRTPKSGLFLLSFPREDSPEFRSIRQQSVKSGTVGSTSAREYGWH